MDKIYLMTSWDGHSYKPVAAFSNLIEAETVQKELSEIFFTPFIKDVDIRAKVNDLLKIDNYWYGPRWGFSIQEINILR